jgi:hypothetical protein
MLGRGERRGVCEDVVAQALTRHAHVCTPTTTRRSNPNVVVRATAAVCATKLMHGSAIHHDATVLGRFQWLLGLWGVEEAGRRTGGSLVEEIRAAPTIVDRSSQFIQRGSSFG